MLATAALRRTVKRALSGEQLAEVRRIRERPGARPAAEAPRPPPPGAGDGAQEGVYVA